MCTTFSFGLLYRCLTILPLPSPPHPPPPPPPIPPFPLLCVLFLDQAFCIRLLVSVIFLSTHVWSRNSRGEVLGYGNSQHSAATEVFVDSGGKIWPPSLTQHSSLCLSLSLSHVCVCMWQNTPVILTEYTAKCTVLTCNWCSVARIVFFQ